MGICDSTMRLNTFLLAMAVLFYGAESTVKSRAYFNETGDLPCHFINSQNISVDNLVAFWQDQDKRVLYELYGGKENQKNVHPAYKGRTSLDLDNWTLRLHNVQIKDTGLYQCFIHHKGPHGLVSTHQKSCDLSVFANFSQPEIIPISNRTEDSNNMNFTCLSTHGYPAPKEMYFLLKTKNSTTKYDTVMNIHQNNITGLYTASISLSLPVSPETNASIFCVLQPEPTQTQLLSEPHNIDADAKSPKPPPRPPGYDTLIAVLLLLLLLIVCGPVLCSILKNKKKKQPGPSRECETTEMEGEESEQAKKRVENRVPGRSDEAKCVVNISKTASAEPSCHLLAAQQQLSSGRESNRGFQSSHS
ncbi:T-lymphocyte activation antigen CD86 isoform 1-T2 [Hipposideros larvatus]